jgi:DnaK suppressor protein
MRFDVLESSVARTLEIQNQLDEAERRGPVVDEALRLRHQRHVASLHRMLSQIEAALGKVHDGTYGTCDGCRNPIPASELAHEPATTLCGDCRGHHIGSE